VITQSTGSITIHRLTEDGTTAVPRVGFCVQRVPGIDLATDAGWTQAVAMTIAEATAAIDAATPPATGTCPTGIATTGANGIVSIPGLPIGLYLIREIVSPGSITPAAPFVLTLPTTDPVTNAAWWYDVNVYPKSGTPGGPTEPPTIGPTEPPTIGPAEPPPPPPPTTGSRPPLAFTGFTAWGIVLAAAAFIIVGTGLRARRSGRLTRREAPSVETHGRNSPDER
jgi:hypothetical protein